MPDGLDISDLDNLFLTSVDDPEAEWLVAYFQTNGTAELFDIEEVGESGGTAQLKISEVE